MGVVGLFRLPFAGLNPLRTSSCNCLQASKLKELYATEWNFSMRIPRMCQLRLKIPRCTG